MLNLTHLGADWRSYQRRYLRHDLVAALTVAIVAVPQSMAYAMIAGVGPVYGLYTSIVAAIVGSLFGSSDHLITGPTNALALMVAGNLRSFTAGGDLLARLFLLTFLVGVFQVALGLLRVGKIVNFVSHAVIVGFTAGAGVIIALGQLNQVLGIGLAKGYHPLYAKVYLTLAAVKTTNWYTLGLALLAMAIVVAAKRVNRNIPGPLLGIVAGAVLAWLFRLADRGVGLVGSIPNGLPSFHLVDLDPGRVYALSGGAFAIAIVGLVEAISIGKSISLSSGQRIEAGREFIGQGLANLVSSFFGCLPSSGSFTRSAVNHDAGAKTRLSGMLSGIFVAAILLAFAPYARYIPLGSLAGVIVVVAYGMVDKHAIKKILAAGRFDITVMLATIVATVLMPDLERAILVGITVSVLVHLWNTGEIRVKILVPDGRSVFREVEVSQRVRRDGPPGILIVHVEGDLYFGSAAGLGEKLEPIVTDKTARICILRLKRINVIDISAFEVIEGFIKRSRDRGKTVLLCGVSPPMKRLLDKVGLTALVGEENVFLAEDQVYASSRKAFEKARKLLRAS